MLDQMEKIEVDSSNKDQKEFKKMTKELNKFANQADSLLDKFAKMESNWFFSKALKFFK